MSEKVINADSSQFSVQTVGPARVEITGIFLKFVLATHPQQYSKAIFKIVSIHPFA